MADGITIKNTEDLVVGDVIATPAGNAEILTITVEHVIDAPLYGWNGDSPWVTSEHPFATYDDPSVYAAVDFTILIAFWPWLENDFKLIKTGTSLVKFDASTGQKSRSIVKNLNRTPAGSSFTGLVYSYVAWPLTVPAGQVPTIYMMGNGYAAFSYAQPLIPAAAGCVVLRSASTVSFAIVSNPPSSPVDQRCWGKAVGDVHGELLTAELVQAYEDLYPNTAIPESPPAGYTSPPQEWLDQLKVDLSQGAFKRDNWGQVEVRTSYFYAEIHDYFDFQASFVGHTMWLNWIPYSEGSQIAAAALTSFTSAANSYDYTSLAAGCAA